MMKTVADQQGGEAKVELQKPVSYGAASMTDLETDVDWNGCEALNTANKGKLDSVLKQGLRDQAEILLESDADEQLLLTVSFQSKVKVHSMIIDGPHDGRAPKGLKLFVNDTPGFEEAEDKPATQEFELTEDELGKRLELRFVKFQSVDKLTFFISGNQGDGETSAISRIQLWGTGLQTMKMGDFKRVAGEKGEGE